MRRIDVLRTTLTRTRHTPSLVSPILSAAPRDRSRLRPLTYGPRSFIRTTTERPLPVFVTRTREPIGRVLDAAVSSLGLKVSPSLVRCPTNPGPYQDATSSLPREGGGEQLAVGAGEGGRFSGAGRVEHPNIAAATTKPIAMISDRAEDGAQDLPCSGHFFLVNADTTANPSLRPLREPPIRPKNDSHAMAGNLGSLFGRPFFTRLY